MLKISAAITLLVATSVSLCAQGASSLRGTVTDPSKAVLAVAKLTLSDKEAGITRSAVTSSTGEYQFLQVRPGSYALTVEAPGFAVKHVEGLALLVDTPSTLDLVWSLPPARRRSAWWRKWRS